MTIGVNGGAWGTEAKKAVQMLCLVRYTLRRNPPVHVNNV
jgi:hypothetical protein